MQHYIGIDGGGTNSRILAVDEQQNVLFNSSGKSTNLASNSKQFVKDSLVFLLDECWKATGLSKEECAGFCIGSAGLDSESSVAAMQEIIESLGFSCPITVVNDSVLALRAADKTGTGVIVISGTGSIACGMAGDGSLIRCGGWGHLLDDGGSAYWIGKEAMRRSLMCYDAEEGETILCEYIPKEFGVSHITECVDHIYSDFNKTMLAKLSMIVHQAAKEGDGISLSILQDAAKELAALAQAVMHRIRQHVPVVIVSGSTILNNDILFQMFQDVMQEMTPHIQIQKLQQKPVWGAINLAMIKK